MAEEVTEKNNAGLQDAIQKLKTPVFWFALGFLTNIIVKAIVNNKKSSN